jgi:DNA-binding NtrC family response regulator
MACKAGDPATTMGQCFRILLVEDDDSLRASLDEFLASQGWAVAATGQPKEAIDLVRQQRFDFSILDFHLPETTGPELLRKLAAVRPLPSILMSGLASAAEAQAARNAGFFTFLRKPLELHGLRRTLEQLIHAHFGGPVAPRRTTKLPAFFATPPAPPPRSQHPRPPQPGF